MPIAIGDVDPMPTSTKVLRSVILATMALASILVVATSRNAGYVSLVNRAFAAAAETDIADVVELLGETFKCPLKMDEERTDCECDACHNISTITTKVFGGNKNTLEVSGNSVKLHVWEVNSSFGEEHRDFSYTAQFTDFGSTEIVDEVKVVLRCANNVKCVTNSVRSRWSAWESGTKRISVLVEDGRYETRRLPYPVCDGKCNGEVVEQRRSLSSMTLVFCDPQIASFAKEAIDRLIRANGS